MKVSSIRASHSFWKMARSPGTEVADTGRGRTTVLFGECVCGREGGKGGVGSHDRSTTHQDQFSKREWVAWHAPLLVLIGIKSSAVSSSPVAGSFPSDSRYFRITRCVFHMEKGGQNVR